MEAYAQVLSIAIPFFTLLIVIEEIVARIKGVEVNRLMDTISSLSSGLTNTLKEIMGLTVVVVSYKWMASNLAVFEIQSSVWMYILAFIGLDFAGYWSHRFSHVINVFWNRHIVHHSSEEFNLSCALRQSISEFVAIFFFLYIPMAIIGIPAKVVMIVAPIHLFAQFWYHTRLIKRMGFLEHIIVTPSHHRVHHAINDEYLDKNFAQIFIVWDKWFGTFQEELEDVPAVYGTKKPAATWNPIVINFQHIWMLAKDAWSTQNWWDKIRIWFMPTGWRPADVQLKYPISIITNPYEQEKYESPASGFLKAWSAIQLVIHNLLIYYALVHIADFQYVDIFLYAVFLMVSVFSYTTLMDLNRLALPVELIKLLFGIYLIYRMGGWYMMDNYFGGATVMMLVYFGLSMLLTFYFSYFERSQKLVSA